MMTPEWIAYAEAHTTPESTVLERLNRETHLTQVYPRMLAGQLQGTFLRMISQMIRPRRILEIGTFTGYSTINLAYGLEPDGMIHTIEINPELEATIRRYISEAGLDHRVILHTGDAINIIPELSEAWDLVYIDADKPRYTLYYNLVFDRLLPGGFFLADNALWDGKVLQDRSKYDKDTLGIAEFNEYIQRDERVENLLLPFRDGIMLIRKNTPF